MRASAETIYQFIYSKHGLKLNIPSYLKFRSKKHELRKSRKRKKPNITTRQVLGFKTPHELFNASLSNAKLDLLRYKLDTIYACSSENFIGIF